MLEWGTGLVNPTCGTAAGGPRRARAATIRRMFGPQLRVKTDRLGRLSVLPPRRLYAIFAVALSLAAMALATRWGRLQMIELGWSGNAHWVAALGALLVAAPLAQQALWGKPLVFDAERAVVLRGERVLARFADLSHVEIFERRGEDGYRLFTLRVRRTSGRPIFLGRERDDGEADRAAARVATVIDKPVRHVVR